MLAPGGTPRPVTEQISKEIAHRRVAYVAKQMGSQGEQGCASTPEEFSRFFRAEVEKYSKRVKLANIRVE